jgi:hypothetical protein
MTNGTISTDIYAGENVIAALVAEGLGIELDRDAVDPDTESPLIDELVDAATSEPPVGTHLRHAVRSPRQSPTQLTSDGDRGAAPLQDAMDLPPNRCRRPRLVA